MHHHRSSEISYPSPVRRRSLAIAALGVLLAGCRDTTAPFIVGPWVQTGSGVSVRGWVAVRGGSPDTLRFGMSLANRGRAAGHWGTQCDYVVRVYSAEGSSGRLVWSSPDHQTCSGQAMWRAIPPGDSLPTPRRLFEVTAEQILGDSLPAERYRFVLSPPVSADTPRFEGSTYSRTIRQPPRIFVPLGVLRLRP